MGRRRRRTRNKFLVPRIKKISLFLKYSNFLPQQNVLNSNIFTITIIFCGKKKRRKKKIKTDNEKKKKRRINKRRRRRKIVHSFLSFLHLPQTPPHFVLLLCHFLLQLSHFQVTTYSFYFLVCFYKF